MKTVDVLIAEIGSTTTVVSAIDEVKTEKVHIVTQGHASTTVCDGDVVIGLEKAVAVAERNLGDSLRWSKMFASSSAAGGLRMTVHGLVFDMTVKAAKEAALGAGANIHLITAGTLTSCDVDNINRIKPNIILLAGGVDFGEKDTVVANAHRLTTLENKAPVIYAGNVAARELISRIFEKHGFSVNCVPNVYPQIDQLNIEPTRRAIQEVFEKHIVEAPGMHKIRQWVGGRIIPTPGAVMRAAVLLKERLGDLLVVDVGGATTDIHSVTEGNPQISSISIAPEPVAKRTVEGDLGVYVNAGAVLELCDANQMSTVLGCAENQLLNLCSPIPSTQKERNFIQYLTEAAAKAAMERHAGCIDHLYGPTGRIAVARGKDLTKVQWIIGTGGALTRLPGGTKTLSSLNVSTNSTRLFPRNAKVLIDQQYIMAAAGLLADDYPRAALELMERSLGQATQEVKGILDF